MRCIGGLLTAATMAIVLQGEVRAIVTGLSEKDIDRALKLAQTSEQTRAQFHAPYVVRVNDPVVEQIEVVSEFRRYVLTAEEQLRLGNWLFAHSVRDAQEKLRPWRERVSIVARLRFHPHNTLMGIPPYDVTIGGPDVAPLDVVRTPITALLSGKRGDFNAPLMGATIEAVFDARSVGRTARPLSVSLTAQPVARVTIDFAKLE
jgi:hypothetical protein